MHVKLNDPGQTNGTFRYWLNGEPIVEETGLNLQHEHRGLQPIRADDELLVLRVRLPESTPRLYNDDGPCSPYRHPARSAAPRPRRNRLRRNGTNHETRTPPDFCNRAASPFLAGVKVTACHRMAVTVARTTLAPTDRGVSARGATVPAVRPALKARP
jgi:hypothetical protein